jgi:serine/threonine-protein phosphatase 2B regulatory subunit
MDLFASMQLTRSEVKKMYKIFTRVDLDGSGSVDIAELLTLLDIERTRFTEQVFTVFDSDGSGKVDFKEFVMAIWNYCTIGQASLGT